VTETYAVKNSIYISSGRISDHEIPTLFSTHQDHSADYETPAVFVTGNVISGVAADVMGEIICSDISNEHSDNIVEFVAYTVQLDCSDAYIESTTISAMGIVNDIRSSYDVNYLSESFISINDSLFSAEVDSHTDFINSDLFIPGESIIYIDDTPMSLRVTIGTLESARDTVATVDFSSVTYFKIDSSIYCTGSVDTLNVITDLLQGTGRVTLIDSDLFAASKRIYLLECDVMLSDMLKYYLTSDLALASGSAVDVSSDIFNSDCSIKTLGTEIKTRSLFVVDFFLGKFDFIDADSPGYVDIIDFLYPVVESSIMITIDGVQQSLVGIESIGDIKRIHFNPDNNFFSVGEIIISVYAESSIGEVLDHSFVLLYGYNVTPDSVIPILPNSTVVVRGQASNLTFCPHKEAISYYFTTADYNSFNLNMSIIPTSPIDLPVSIYPQSTAFFYGKTYVVTVSGIKDFSGNEMMPFSYSFTIENSDI